MQTPTTTIPESSDVVPTLDDLKGACDASGSWFCERVYDWTGNDTLAGLAEWFVAKPVAIVAILLVAFVVSRLSRWVVKVLVNRAFDRGDRGARARIRKATPNMLLVTAPTQLRSAARAASITSVLRGVASAVVWFVAFIAILEVLEINLGPIIAGAGIAGVALGFGAQNLVRDFLAGTFIILEDQYGVGDIVDLGEAIGSVEKITLRVTRLRDVNGVVWHVPNGQVVRVGNKSQDWARAVLDVDVAYDTDLEQAKEVIEGAAVTMSADPAWQTRILDTPEMWGVEAFSAIGVTMRVVIKTSPGDQADVLRELRLRVKAAFDEAGIEIPTNRMSIPDDLAGDAGIVPPPDSGV